jgi:hypothetical protein
LAVVIGLTASAYAYPIAGVNPDQRPEGAPVYSVEHKSKAWFKTALTGIGNPFSMPSAAVAIIQHGNWYTPFVVPGMVNNYDIRGFHSSSNNQTKNQNN